MPGGSAEAIVDDSKQNPEAAEEMMVLWIYLGRLDHDLFSGERPQSPGNHGFAIRGIIPCRTIQVGELL